MPAQSVDARIARSLPRSVLITVLLPWLLLVPCSGGGQPVGNTGFDCGNDGGDVLCLESCSLGCSEIGCGRTDIAQNEVIVLTFSEEVDPGSVNESSIILRTPTGAPAVGEFYVNGARVEFVPTLQLAAGQTYYGFTTGETYVLTVIGGDNLPAVVRGLSGRPFGQQLTCTLESRRGIIDLDDAAPRAELVSPNRVVDVPVDAAVRIEFSELIDPTPFVSGVQSPVSFRVQRRRATIDGGFECDPESPLQTIPGSQFVTYDAARSVTMLAFQPSEPLPGNSCVEIIVSDGVSDLSGRNGAQQIFRFETEVVDLIVDSRVEEFVGDEQLDRDASAAEWGGGQVTFGSIGGDGRHGSFDLSLAADTGEIVAGRNVYEIDTDDTRVPATSSSTGALLPISDGEFYFTDMVVPADVMLRFVGDAPARITVAGRLAVLGVIDASGRSQLDFVEFAEAPNYADGQPGARGGPGGGDGGRGGDTCRNLGPDLGQFDGVPGEDGSLPFGHAYSESRVGSGGRGSLMVPATGTMDDCLFSTGFAANMLATAGGGGGGSFAPGAVGRIIDNNEPDPGTGVPPWLAAFGPEAAGGSELQLLPFPSGSVDLPSSRHFLFGGGGGGGGGSNCAMGLVTIVRWGPGGGGAGGGGALALRAGSFLLVDADASVLARGGDTVADPLGAVIPIAVPGGGGGGGSIFVQSGGSLQMLGTCDVRGGDGADQQRIFAGHEISLEGGDGANGHVRVEATGATVGDVGTVFPSASLSVVDPQEQDDVVSCQSRFYETGLVFGPQYLRYEVQALVDGVPVLFSDDPEVSTMAATGLSPLRVLWQCANIDPLTSARLATGRWRESVRTSTTQSGIASDAMNSYRFRIVLDRSFGSTVVVQRVEVFYGR